ncbi:MAG: hypothetical protein JRI68_02060 [Deltaproteobacteria bacterium]|nr:hypothetical protein [Deltaproteobacteria bacterium]
MDLRLLFVTVAALVCALVPDTSWAQDHIVRPQHHPRPRPRPREVSLVSVQLQDDQGNALRTFRHRGSTFVLGQHGGRYNIRLSNNTDGRLEVAMLVDGRDVIHGRRSQGSSDRGYLVPARGSVLIKGYRTTMSSVAAFRFSSPGESYAGRHGHAQSVGIINVSAYRERVEAVLVPPPHRPIRPRPPLRHGGIDDRAPATGESADAAPALKHSTRGRRIIRPRPDDLREGGNLGTQFGEHLHSQIRQTTFVRENRHQPNQRLTLRYDDASGLEARGVVVFQRPPVRPDPVHFIEPRFPRFAEPPPPRPHDPWHHHFRHPPWH